MDGEQNRRPHIFDLALFDGGLRLFEVTDHRRAHVVVRRFGHRAPQRQLGFEASIFDHPRDRFLANVGKRCVDQLADVHRRGQARCFELADQPIDRVLPDSI
jgi:hypothetical protein